MSSSTDIEARIAQLDERLRVARAENSALRDRVSPSPSHSRGLNSTASRNVATPINTSYNATAVASARGTVASPRVDYPHHASQSRRVSPPQQSTSSVQRDYNASSNEVMTSQLRELQQRLADTNKNIINREKDIAEMNRKKTIMAAESAKAIDDADLRISDAQQRSVRNTHTMADLQSKKAALSRQLDEVQATTQRSEAKLAELERTKATIDAKISEANVALREREQAVHDEADSFRVVRHRLELRHTELEEENHQASERLRRIEQQFQTQQQQWREEEDGLQREADEAATLLDEMTSRLQNLKSELGARQKEAEDQRQARERRAEELQKQHDEERKKDGEYHKQNLEHRERVLMREREEVLAGLREQIEMLNQQLDRKRANRDKQEQTNTELERALQDFNAKLDQKKQLAQNVETAEEKVRQTTEERDHRREDLNKLRDMISEREAQISQLDKTAQRLALQLEEESRLKSLVYDLAKQLNDLSLSQDVEKAQAERDLKQIQSDKNAADEQVASISGEIERARAAGNADIDVLRRKCDSFRRDISEKENQLRKALQDNATKQSQLAHYEDERRRMERENMARRTAASSAAKNAFNELQ